MSERIEVRINDVGDILYLRFLNTKISTCREFGDWRNLDYDGQGNLIGVELIGLRRGVSLHGLPEAERIRDALIAHGPPELRVEGYEVFHPVNEPAATP